MRYIEWTHRPVGHAGGVAGYAYLLRQADGNVMYEFDRTEFGLFSVAQWRGWVEEAGFSFVSAGDPVIANAFLAKRDP